MHLGFHKFWKRFGGYFSAHISIADIQKPFCLATKFSEGSGYYGMFSVEALEFIYLQRGRLIKRWPVAALDIDDIIGFLFGCPSIEGLAMNCNLLSICLATQLNPSFHCAPFPSFPPRQYLSEQLCLSGG